MEDATRRRTSLDPICGRLFSSSIGVVFALCRLNICACLFFCRGICSLDAKFIPTYARVVAKFDPIHTTSEIAGRAK